MNTMTEAEAQTRWCPFARVVHFADGHPGPGIQNFPSYNRLTHRSQPGAMLPNTANCVASTCMAWAWSGKDPVGGIRRGSCGLMKG